MRDELINDDPRLPVVPGAPHGGAHDGSRLPPEKVAMIRSCYAEGMNLQAITRKMGTTWKVVAALCCPERLHQRATPEQIAEVRQRRDEGAGFQQIANEMGLALRQVKAIAAGDSDIVRKLQETRAARALVGEAIVIEATTEAIERRVQDGKMTIAEGSNALLVFNTMVRDTVGAAPIRVRVEADETMVAAMQLFGGAKALPVKAQNVVEAEVIMPHEPILHDDDKLCDPAP